MNAKKLFKALLCSALAIAVMLVTLTGCSLFEQFLPDSGDGNTDSAKTLVSSCVFLS